VRNIYFGGGKNFANPVKKARRSGRPAKCGICVKISKSRYYEKGREVLEESSSDTVDGYHWIALDKSCRIS